MTHKIAIIGLGIMGRRMLQNASTHPAFDVCAIWDPAQASIAKATALCDAPVVADAEAAMANADVVYLACPPNPRKAYALQAAAADKGVFMEKPLGVDIAESEDLVEQLASARLPAVVNFTQAGSLGFEKLRQAIDANETGELLGIDIAVRYAMWPRDWQVEADWLRFRAEGGYTREVISHFVFLAERFLGPLTLQFAAPRYPQDASLCEIDILARLQTTDGRPVNIMGTTGGIQTDKQQVTVRASKTSFQFRDFFGLWKSDGGPWREVIDWTGKDPRVNALQRQLTELDKWLKGQPHQLASAREALSVQKLIEPMLAAAN